MSFGKNLAVSALLWALLNFIFAILFAAVVIGDVNSLFSSGVGPILGAIFLPAAEPIYGTGTAILFFELDVGAAIILLLWVLLPGILAATISSWKFADESPKTAFFSSALGIYLMIVIAVILEIAADMATGASGIIDMVTLGLPLGAAYEYSLIFVIYLLISFFYAGWGAMASSSF